MLRAYFNQRANIWDEAIAESDPDKLKRMVKRLHIKPGATILDVGTGTGVFLPYLLSQVSGGRVVALDFAERMLKKAQGKGFIGNIDYLQADVTNIPLHPETFDLVVCYSSFPHFHDKPKALAEMKRIMKRGGRLVICHTSSRAQINEIHRQEPMVKDDTLPDTTEMESLLSRAGFARITIEDDYESYLVSAEKPAVSPTSLA